MVIYCRISSDRTGAGLGVQRQEEDCRNLAEQLGWHVVTVLVDNDLSAYSGKRRPSYARLLDMLRAGEATAVIAWHTDRLHRSPVELEEYITVSEAAGAPTVTVQSGPLDLATPSGRLVARQLGAVARYESEHKSARLQRAMLQLATQGKWRGGRRSFGFEADGMTLRPDEAEAVASGIRAVLSGVSLHQVARDWNDAGLVTSRSGRSWTQISVRRTLLRARNAALVEYKGEILGPAQWPAIVEENEWRALAAFLSDSSRRVSPGPEPKYQGSGIYLCGVCSEPVVSGHTSGAGARHRIVYRCGAQALDRSARRHVARDQPVLDEYVERLVLERLGRADASPASAVAGIDHEAAAQLHIRIGTLRIRLDEQATLHAEGEITTAQLRAGTERLRAKLEAAEQQLAATVRSSPLAGLAGAADPEVVWAALPLSRRREVVRALMVVTLLPSRPGRPKGWRPGEPYFTPDHVAVEWL